MDTDAINGCLRAEKDITIKLEECGIGEYLDGYDQETAAAEYPCILHRAKRMIKGIIGRILK